MAIKIELKIVDQMGTLVSFWQKKLNGDILMAIMCQTIPLAKLPPEGGGGGVLIFIYPIDVFYERSFNFFREMFKLDVVTKDSNHNPIWIRQYC